MNAKKIIFLIGILITGPGNIYSQQMILTIDECHQKAKVNYPLIKQYRLIEQSKEYSLSNISKGYLPQLTLNGQATYQSEVVSFPISVPGVDIPAIDKNQYKATLDISQTIWDGGNIRSQQNIAKANTEVEKQNLEVNLYTIRERVNQLYFGLLTIDEQLKQLNILNNDLQNSFAIVNAMLENGTSTQSDVDAVQVEILNTDQKRTELKAFRNSYSEMLSAMIGEKITDNIVLQTPVDTSIDPLSPISRPEIMLFEKQRLLFDQQKNTITAKNMPKLGLFLQGGYGKPGLNMLSNEFDFFALGGVKLSWNLGNLYSRSNDKNMIITNKSKIDSQEETFIFNTNLQLTQIHNDILKDKELIQKDDEIIKLRHRVKTAAESKYENGVYTVNDLIKDINAESQSRQAKILHEIQYLLNKYNYKNISGN